MKIRLKGLASCLRVWINDEELSPRRSQKVYNHSPDGFNWGYGGSGPSQLALAILLEFTDEATAVRNYQKFKWNVISELGDDFDEEIDISLYI